MFSGSSALMSKLYVKNWTRYQHYKTRRPPWIKLHRELLENYGFHRLPIASKALAPLLWLLASESEDGSIEHDITVIGFRVRMTETQINQGLQPLIDAGFVQAEQDASSVLAGCKQDATPKTETEREAEVEIKTEGAALPEWIPVEQWNAFIEMRKSKKASPTPYATKLLIKRLDSLRKEGQNAAKVLDQSTANCWKDLFPVRNSTNPAPGLGYRAPKATSLAGAKVQ
jgi:hypothetical protein